jgi:2-polyprenyl-6-methoxyphenol hydroxylase-like FAD-dependent oxidoreductase
MDTDVLVVGAGPTGLMLANQLVRRGVRPLIIDRHAGPSRETRALGVQARTLEIYAQLGIVERALDLGKRATGANMWAQGRRTARIPLGSAGRDLTPYPFVLILGQDDNERIMGDRLRELGVSVAWNTELTDILQEPDKVTATLRQPDGTERKVSAAWVAGCDGAHSAVRELSGIEFPGAPYEHVFFVADTEATGTMVADELNVYLWQDGFHLLFPMRGDDHWRVVGILPPALRNRDDVTFADVIPSLRSEAGASLSFKACTWFSTYRIHHRSAARFRDRRCFLLGDAAHIHSPVGAQGMNTGLQDAYNLAWKLALVIDGQADAALLDSYEEERVPVARRLLNTTDRAFRLIVSDSWLAGLLRTKVIARIAAFAMRREPIQRFAFRVVSQTGIRYRNSSLAKTLDGVPDGASRGGDRFPWLRLKFRHDGPVEDSLQELDDRRFNLIVIGQPSAVEGALPVGDPLRIHAIPSDPVNDAELARARIPQPSFYLLRPDGHVGLCGIRLEAEAVTRYLSDNLHLAPQRA